MEIKEELQNITANALSDLTNDRIENILNGIYDCCREAAKIGGTEITLNFTQCECYTAGQQLQVAKAVEASGLSIKANSGFTWTISWD